MATEQRDHTKRERDIGCHGHSPAVARIGTGVNRCKERRWDDHAADGGGNWKRSAAQHTKLAEHELALDLEPNHQEEQRHQPIVHPMLQRELQHVVTERDGELVRPQRVVAARRNVDPNECGHSAANGQNSPR